LSSQVKKRPTNGIYIYIPFTLFSEEPEKKFATRKETDLGYCLAYLVQHWLQQESSPELAMDFATGGSTIIANSDFACR
jgi:hypothetical protein